MVTGVHTCAFRSGAGHLEQLEVVVGVAEGGDGGVRDTQPDAQALRGDPLADAEWSDVPTDDLETRLAEDLRQALAPVQVTCTEQGALLDGRVQLAQRGGGADQPGAEHAIQLVRARLPTAPPGPRRDGPGGGRRACAGPW